MSEILFAFQVSLFVLEIGTGEAHAIVRIAGKPLVQFKQLKKINKYIRFVPIPYENNLLNSAFLPTQFSRKDYPDLVPAEQPVSTVAIQTVLAVYNWPEESERYQRLAKFVEAFFSNYGQMMASKGRHSKWEEVNLTGDVAGWTRFRPAQEWLERNAKLKGANARKQRFKKFIRQEQASGQVTPDIAESEDLFIKFKKWEETLKP